MKTVIAVLVLSIFAQAKTVLISDIDDTIKVSNVLDKTSAIENSNRTDSVFFGMPQLYHLIQQTTGAKLYYLSNAPKAVMTYYHRQFLIQNEFPNGGLLLRENVLSKNHKIRSIREIIRVEKPTTLILIGDNGEHDPEVYHQAKQEYPRLRIYTYIRQAYSAHLGKDRGTELFPNQMGIVSPMEIALSLREMAVVDLNKVDALENFFVPLALNQRPEQMAGALAFPGWQDCRDYKAPNSLYQRRTDLGQQLLMHILKRCSIPGIDPDSLRAGTVNNSQLTH